MNSDNINRLKKYLFLISIFFSFIIGGHIIYVYLYDNSLESPSEGGSVSEGIIGDFPHLNPLLSSNDYNKNIIYMLYRSLLKYDFEKKEIVSDLANCDVKNLNYIECYLKDNVKWSNGENITAQDVVATYNIIKNSDINNSLGSLLKDTIVEEKSGIITFSNKLKDVNFLQALFQPIVPKTVLDNIGNKELYGKFNPIDGIYSGPYKVETVSYDDSLGIQKLILTKNENYKESNILISKYIFKIFKDEAHFLRLKDVNIFFDKNKIIGDSIPRLEQKPYFLNQYVSLFINEDKIKDFNLRNFILGKVDTGNILKTLGNGYKEVTNPFLEEGLKQNNEIKNTNLVSIINENGFYKKDQLLNKLTQNSASGQTNTGKTNSDLSFISSPFTKKYNFFSEDNILITGITKDKNPDEIYINGYKLASYKSGETKFYYRLKLSYRNLVVGENNYKIEFVIGGKKQLVEEFNIVFSTDKEKLANIEKNYFGVVEKPKEISEEQKTKILSLDEKYFYNENLEKFVLKLYYIDNNKELSQVVNIIKNNLESYGIIININSVTIDDLNKEILDGVENYDLLLVGLNLGYQNYNIFPYFHSSQSKGGFSFSNIKNLSLDILLEELKSNVLSKEKRFELEKKVVQILDEKQIFKSLYTKENVVLIDKNIKGFSLNENSPGDFAIIDAIYKSYVNSDKKIIFTNKGIYDFIKFIKRVFNNEGQS